MKLTIKPVTTPAAAATQIDDKLKNKIKKTLADYEKSLEDSIEQFEKLQSSVAPSVKAINAFVKSVNAVKKQFDDIERQTRETKTTFRSAGKFTQNPYRQAFSGMLSTAKNQADIDRLVAGARIAEVAGGIGGKSDRTSLLRREILQRNLRQIHSSGGYSFSDFLISGTGPLRSGGLTSMSPFANRLAPLSADRSLMRASQNFTASRAYSKDAIDVTPKPRSGFDPNYVYPGAAGSRLPVRSYDANNLPVRVNNVPNRYNQGSWNRFTGSSGYPSNGAMVPYAGPYQVATRPPPNWASYNASNGVRVTPSPFGGLPINPYIAAAWGAAKGVYKGYNWLNKEIGVSLPDKEAIARAGRITGNSTVDIEGQLGRRGSLVLNKHLMRLGYTSMAEAANTMSAYGAPMGQFGAFVNASKLSQSKYGGFQNAQSYAKDFSAFNRMGVATNDESFGKLQKAVKVGFTEAIKNNFAPQEFYKNMMSYRGFAESSGFIKSIPELAQAGGWGQNSAIPTVRNGTALQTGSAAYNQLAGNVLGTPVAYKALQNYMFQKTGNLQNGAAGWRKTIMASGLSGDQADKIITAKLAKELDDPFVKANPWMGLGLLQDNGFDASTLMTNSLRSIGRSPSNPNSPLSEATVLKAFAPKGTGSYNSHMLGLDPKADIPDPLEPAKTITTTRLRAATFSDSWRRIWKGHIGEAIRGEPVVEHETMRLGPGKDNAIPHYLPVGDWYSGAEKGSYNVNGKDAGDLGNIRESTASFKAAAKEFSNGLSGFASGLAQANNAVNNFISTLGGTIVP